MDEFIDNLMGYIIVPLLILFGADVHAIDAVQALWNRAGRELHETYINVRLAFIRYAARRVVRILLVNAVALIAGLVAANALPGTRADLSYTLMRMVGFFALGLAFLAWYQMPAVVNARDVTTDPNTGEDIFPPTFRPGRLNVSVSSAATIVAWATFSVCMVVCGAVEENPFFLPFAVSSAFIAYSVGWLYITVVGKALEALGTITEGAYNFLQDQLAVLAPGIRWENLRQFIRPKDFFDQAFPHVAGRSLIDMLLANLLMVVLGQALLTPSVTSLLFTAAVIGTIQVGVFAAVLLSKGVKYRVEVMRERFALRLVGVIGLIAIVVWGWRFYAAPALQDVGSGYNSLFTNFLYGHIGPEGGSWWRNLLFGFGAALFALLAWKCAQAVQGKVEEGDEPPTSILHTVLKLATVVCVVAAIWGFGKFGANILGVNGREQITLPLQVGMPSDVPREVKATTSPFKDEPRQSLAERIAERKAAKAPEKPKPVPAKKAANKPAKKAAKSPEKSQSDDLWDPGFQALYNK